MSQQLFIFGQSIQFRFISQNYFIGTLVGSSVVFIDFHSYVVVNCVRYNLNLKYNLH